MKYSTNIIVNDLTMSPWTMMYCANIVNIGVNISEWKGRTKRTKKQESKQAQIYDEKTVASAHNEMHNHQNHNFTLVNPNSSLTRQWHAFG